MEMSLDWNDAVFCKTAKAQEELALRSHGLRPKARQLLVLLDGVRTLGSLSKLMAAHELHTLARELKDSELSAGVTPTVIAIDGIAIIVNNDNPISGLTAEQVRQIYVGEMLNWAEVQ